MSNLYFNHFYGLRNQTEILEIRAEFGAEGYGLYLMLLETIAESETQSINKNLVKGLSLNLYCEVEKLKNIINFCVKLNLFYLESDFIFSNHLKVHLEKRTEIKEKRAEAGKLGGRPKANEKQLLSKSLANGKQTEPKESKVKKESKETKINIKESNENIINDFFNDLVFIENLIKENLVPYENQVWFTEQATATITAIKNKMLVYYTEDGKGVKKEIKLIKPRFLQFLNGYKRTDFFKFTINKPFNDGKDPTFSSKFGCEMLTKEVMERNSAHINPANNPF